MEQGQLFIDGQFVDATDGRTFESRNPFDDSCVGYRGRAGGADVDRAVQRCLSRLSSRSLAPIHPGANGRTVLRQIADGMKRRIATSWSDARWPIPGATRKKGVDDVMSTIGFLEQYAGIAAAFRQERPVTAWTTPGRSGTCCATSRSASARPSSPGTSR